MKKILILVSFSILILLSCRENDFLGSSSPDNEEPQNFQMKAGLTQGFSVKPVNTSIIAREIGTTPSGENLPNPTIQMLIMESTKQTLVLCGKLITTKL